MWLGWSIVLDQRVQFLARAHTYVVGKEKGGGIVRRILGPGLEGILNTQ